MKQIVTIFLIVCSSHLMAQTEKGTTMVGGNFGFKTGKESNEFLLTPNIGVFAANNFALGGFLNFTSKKLGNTTTTDFGLGPFLRYYFGKTATKPFVLTEFNFLSNTTKSGNTKINTIGFGFLMGMGFAAFINDAVAVEGVTGYNYSKYKDVDGSSGFSMRLGFQIYLNNNSVQTLKTNVSGN